MYAFMVAKLSHEATALGLTQSEKYETRLKLRQNKGNLEARTAPTTSLFTGTYNTHTLFYA